MIAADRYLEPHADSLRYRYVFESRRGTAVCLGWLWAPFFVLVVYGLCLLCLKLYT